MIDSSKPSLRLAVLTVYYNPEGGIFGFKHIWTVDGQKIEADKHRGSSYDDVFGSWDKKNIKLGKGQYITKVYGRSGDYLDQICFELNTGEVIELGGEGGEPFEVALPEGSAVGCITGGIGGHLHNIQVWYGPKNDIQENPAACFYLPIDNRFPHSKSVGKTHGDTTAFHDDININQQNFRIDTIKIYYTNFCVGVMWIYEVDGQYIYGGKHIGSWIKAEDKKDVAILNMEVDEFVIKVSGHADNQIESLHLETNKGRVLDAGRKKKGSHFDIDIPAGHCLGKIEGGKNGHLHNLKFYYGLLPTVYTNKK